MWMVHFVVMKLEVPGPLPLSYYVTGKIKNTVFFYRRSLFFLRFELPTIYMWCIRVVSPYLLRRVIFLIPRNLESSPCINNTAQWEGLNTYIERSLIYTDLYLQFAIWSKLHHWISVRESWSTYAIVIHMIIHGIIWLCPQYKNRESLSIMLLFMSKT